VSDPTHLKRCRKCRRVLALLRVRISPPPFVNFYRIAHLSRNIDIVPAWRGVSMRKFLVLAVLGSLVMFGCAGTQDDSYVDSELGLGNEDSKQAYDAAADELKQQRYEDGTRRLQELAAGPEF